jgi:hypothetical protein
MRINYPKNSKYFESFDDLLSQNSLNLKNEEEVHLASSEDYKYQTEEIEVFIDKAKKDFFFTSWWKTQVSLFPARISALVSVLKQKGYSDAWVIRNTPEGIILKRDSDRDKHFSSSFSWDTYKNLNADKLIDKSAVIHSGTGVPSQITDFFLRSNNQAPDPIVLIYKSIKYECRLSHDAQHERYRVFWPSEFASIISSEFPKLREIFLSGGIPNQDYWIRFTKTNIPNSYEIKFATYKGDANSKSKTPLSRIADDIHVTVGQIIDYVDRHKNTDLATSGGKSSFRVTKGDKGITFHVSTGKDRLHRWAFLQRVTDRFNEVKSMKVTSYGDITVNASYNLALIRGVLEELGKFQEIKDNDPFSKTADRAELEKRASLLSKIPKRGKSVGNLRPKKVITTFEAYVRDPHVVSDVLQRSSGTCELCKKLAPFNRPTGEPFLEVHHIIGLAEGGADVVENAVALCPNCHREAHHGEYAELIKEELG